MTGTPWSGDACSLVDAFRRGERSPREELDASLAAIGATDLNCFSFVDPDRAIAAADQADVGRPLGGVPVGLKELDSYEGWPDTEASLVFEDRIAEQTHTSVRRLRDRGGSIRIPAGLVDGLPVGMQVLTRHHADAVLLDLALVAEREIGWPATAPAAG